MKSIFGEPKTQVEAYRQLFHSCEAKQQVLDHLEELARRYDAENEVNSRVLAKQFIRIIEGTNGQ